MNEGETAKRWEKTRLQNLVRNAQSGVYYARAFSNGKEIWKSLKTAHFSIAETKLAKFLEDQRKVRSLDPERASAKMTFAQAEEAHRRRLAAKVDLKPRTRVYWNEVLAALHRSWPALAASELRKVTPRDCEEWAARYSKTVSSTRYNNTVAVLKHVFEAGMKAGAIYANPAEVLTRVRVRPKMLNLPDRAQFQKMIGIMRAGGSRDSKNCADLAEGLAFTGCRISEAGFLEWRDVDFSKSEVVVRGDPETATKNGEIRRIPLIPAAALLFQRMRLERAEESAEQRVFLVHECQKSLDRAANLAHANRITHHDLRHLFATTCIESGIDIPTVSRWLGHKDGGALAMRVYGHLRDDHSRAQAKRVSFEPAEAGEKVVPFKIGVA